MKRWGILILVCLLLGVVTTVAVAWIRVIDDAHGDLGPSTFIIQIPGDYTVITSVSRYSGYYGASRGFPAPSQFEISMKSTDYEAVVPHWSHFVGTRSTSEDAAWFRAEGPGSGCQKEIGAGWPMLALSGFSKSKWVDDGTGGGGQVVDENAGLFKGPSWLQPYPWSDVRFPYRPIWLGFAVDSAAWGAVWPALYLFMRFGFRRRKRMRVKRGQCLACGYSLVGNTTGKCPECGAVTAARAAT